MERLDSVSNRIPVIAAAVPAWLQKNGVKLLGVDLPSMDELDSKSLQNHHALARAGIAIIESLDLSDVAPGIYNFAALPLKSPVPMAHRCAPCFGVIKSAADMCLSPVGFCPQRRSALRHHIKYALSLSGDCFRRHIKIR